MGFESILSMLGPMLGGAAGGGGGGGGDSGGGGGWRPPDTLQWPNMPAKNQDNSGKTLVIIFGVGALALLGAGIWSATRKR